MTIEELTKALGLEGEDFKDKVKILSQEFKAKEKEFNELSKKLKDLEKDNETLKASADTNNPIVDKFNIAAKAFGFDLEAEDFDKMLDDIKDRLSKEGSNGVTPEDVKQMKRDLTKANRDLEKANSNVKELTEQLETEKSIRITSLKRSALKKELEAVNALNPEMFVDLFLNKVEVDKDGSILTMKDAAGNDISVADGIADWAKENTDLVKKTVRGGAGSGGNGNKDNNEVSDFVKSMIANNSPSSDSTGGKSLAEMFG